MSSLPGQHRTVVMVHPEHRTFLQSFMSSGEVGKGEGGRKTSKWQLG